MATIKVPAHTRNGKKVKGYSYERKASPNARLRKRANMASKHARKHVKTKSFKRMAAKIRHLNSLSRRPKRR